MDFITETQRAQRLAENGKDYVGVCSPPAVLRESLCPPCLCGEAEAQVVADAG